MEKICGVVRWTFTVLKTTSPDFRAALASLVSVFVCTQGRVRHRARVSRMDSADKDVIIDAPGC